MGSLGAWEGGKHDLLALVLSRSSCDRMISERTLELQIVLDISSDEGGYHMDTEGRERTPVHAIGYLRHFDRR